MIAPLAAMLLAAAPVATAADSAVRDSLAQRKVVREFAPVLVVGDRASDPRSIESVQRLPAASLRRLAVDRLVDAVGLRAGVVVTGEDLHVRGGRAGELATSLGGFPLNESRRGTPMEVPLFAIRSADLLTGGLDADHAGSLAGMLELESEVPTARPTVQARYTSDARLDTGFDALYARGAGPFGATGLGFALAGEMRLDDLGLPETRSRGRTNVLGASLGWRADNRVLGWARLAPVARPQRASLEVLASRVVRQPYNPMFDFDGWVSFQPDPVGPDGVYLGRPLATSDRKLDDTYFRYRAGDHLAMSEERRLAAIATFSSGSAASARRVVLGWMRESALSSVGLRGDRAYVNDRNRPIFGPSNYEWADPFHAYYGDEPYFRDSGSSRWFARADAARSFARNHRVRAGAGLAYEHVRFDELDDAAVEIRGVDTLRSFRAWAPGAFAYVQHRWDYGGLVWNAGLRVSAFTAGPQAEPMDTPPFLRTGEPWNAPTIWSWSPRLGFAYPVSDRDAFSLAYSRVFQDPPRELLYENRFRIYDRHPLGNPRLRPAEVISYQAAIKHVLDPGWSMQLGVFYRDVYGQPGTRTYQPIRGVYFLRYEDADDAHATGVEFSILRQWASWRRAEFTYTFMNAWGTQSNLEGLAYGATLGARPVPTGQHPLDWDQRHAFTFVLQTDLGRDFTLSWNTRLASGLPWTPLYRGTDGGGAWPAAYADQSKINSRRLPWSENTNLALRWNPPILFGGALIFAATNVFANTVDRLTTISGYPHPLIGTLYDEYGAFRTETGLGGGAYWDDANGDGAAEWVRVHDRRLSAVPRTLRLGIEFAR